MVLPIKAKCLRPSTWPPSGSCPVCLCVRTMFMGWALRQKGLLLPLTTTHGDSIFQEYGWAVGLLTVGGCVCEDYMTCLLVRVWALDVWGELVPSKIFNPPFPVLKAGHSVSYSYICDVWSGLMGWVSFYLKISVWLVSYAHDFHVFVSGWRPRCVGCSYSYQMVCRLDPSWKCMSCIYLAPHVTYLLCVSMITSHHITHTPGPTCDGAIYLSLLRPQYEWPRQKVPPHPIL